MRHEHAYLVITLVLLLIALVATLGTEGVLRNI